MNKKNVSVKKILAALVAVVMVMAIMPAAFAATISITECDVVEDTITLEIALSQTENSMEHLIAIVTSGSEAATYDNAVAFQYSTASSTSATIEILMPDKLPTGTYTVTVGSPISTNTASQQITYMGYADRQAIVDSINGEADAQSLVNAFNNSPIALDASGSKNDYYKALSNDAKLQFAQYIIDNREAGDVNKNGKLDMTEIGDVANEALVIVYASNDTLSDAAYKLGYEQVFSDFADYIDLDVEDERYVMIADAPGFFKVLRAQLGTEAPTLKNIEDSLEMALTLQRINEVGYLVICNEIDKYGKLLGIGTTMDVTYDMLDEIMNDKTKKDYFGKAMKATGTEYKNVHSYEKLPVTSVDQLERAIIRSYADAIKKAAEDVKPGPNRPNNNTTTTPGGVTGGPYVIDQDTIRPDPLGVKKLITDYYDDMAGYEWAETAVLALTESGIVNGTGERKYEPARVLKREEFMKLLVNTFNLVDMTATCSFTDVTDTNEWYYVYVASAEKAGITTGRGDGTFGLGDEVTREEMATMVYRAARLRGVNLGAPGRSNVIYSDMDSLSAFALEAVLVLSENGVMSGSDGKFSPKDGATRAQAAVVINNINNLKSFK